MLMQPNNDYDFITNPAKPPQRKLIGYGNSMQSRIIIVAIGVLLMIFIGLGVTTLLSSGEKEYKSTLLKITQQQAELIRISDMGSTKARNPDTLNLAITTKATLKTDQATMLTRVKANEKLLAQLKDSKTDQLLISAEQSNNFDEVFTKTIKAQLLDYQATLKLAYDSSSNKATRADLEKLFNNASTLTQQD